VCRPDPRRTSRHRHVRAVARDQGRRPVAAGAGALLRHPAPPRRDAVPRLRPRHAGRWLPRRLHLVYPIKVNQQRSVVETDPARATAASASAWRPAASRSCWRCWRTRARRRRGLQRLQGPRVHPPGADRPARWVTASTSWSRSSPSWSWSSRSPGAGHHAADRLRVRLASIGAGKWQNTGGEKSKFGLSASQVLAPSSACARANLLAALQLVHFHMGSQIANIQHIQLRHARGGALLRRAARRWARRYALHERRRRPGRGLRGHALAQLLLDELQRRRVRAQHRACLSEICAEKTCRIPTSSPNPDGP
jgi:hypothetical protein